MPRQGAAHQRCEALRRLVVRGEVAACRHEPPQLPGFNRPNTPDVSRLSAFDPCVSMLPAQILNPLMPFLDPSARAPRTIGRVEGSAYQFNSVGRGHEHGVGETPAAAASQISPAAQRDDERRALLSCLSSCSVREHVRTPRGMLGCHRRAFSTGGTRPSSTAAAPGRKLDRNGGRATVGA
jgi:hypothetical protein